MLSHALRSMKFYICASPDYIERHGAPLTPEEIQHHNCLLFPRRGFNLNWLFRDSSGRLKDIPIQGRCLITNSNAIRECAAAGMGLALLPDWLIDDDIRKGTLISLFDDYEVTATDYDSAVWILRPSRQYMPRKVAVFLDYLEKNYQKHREIIE